MKHLDPEVESASRCAGRTRWLLTAAVGAAAFATLAISPRTVSVADTPPEMPTFRGRETYGVRRVVTASRPLVVAVALSEFGEFRVRTDRDDWNGQVVGSGAQSHVEMTPQQIEAIEDSIERDLGTRFAQKFVTRAVRKELEAVQRESATRAAARDAVVARIADLTTRIGNLLSGGGAVPLDLVQSLQSERAIAEAELVEATAAVAEMVGALAAATDRVAPTFDVTLAKMNLTFRQNASRTRVRVKARIDFVARNLKDFREHSGRLSVTGRGPYAFSRG